MRDHEAVLEADLQRHYGVDYRDRWRRHPNGGRLLTLRRIYVLVSVLPEDAALVQKLNPDASQWRLEHFLLDDLRMTIAQVMGAKGVKAHPSRPKPRKARTDEQGRARSALTPAEREKRIEQLRQRVEERRRRFEAEGA